jgi:hypothetical protein
VGTKGPVHGAVLVAALAAAMIGAPVASAGQSEAASAVVSTAHFAIYSDLATNVHDALIADAGARRGRRPAPFDAGPEKACFDALPAADRAGWTSAVDYYTSTQSTDFQRVLVRLDLAGAVQRDKLPDGVDRPVVEAFAGVRDGATPAYRRCRWEKQDAANRAWIAHVEGLLRQHERGLGDQLPLLFQSPWAGLPFRVDVVGGGPPTGANSASSREPGVHILVSSSHPSNQGPAALELIFHEASHALAQPGKPLADALATATKNASAAGATVPRDLLHQLHFYIAGEAVRRSLQRAGESYSPYLFSLKIYSDRFREAVARIWPAYMDGTRSLADASAELIGAISGPVPARPATSAQQP